jgi:hypothetical protein
LTAASRSASKSGHPRARSAPSRALEHHQRTQHGQSPQYGFAGLRWPGYQATDHRGTGVDHWLHDAGVQDVERLGRRALLTQEKRHQSGRIAWPGQAVGHLIEHSPQQLHQVRPGQGRIRHRAKHQRDKWRHPLFPDLRKILGTGAIQARLATEVIVQRGQVHTGPLCDGAGGGVLEPLRAEHLKRRCQDFRACLDAARIAPSLWTTGWFAGHWDPRWACVRRRSFNSSFQPVTGMHHTIPPQSEAPCKLCSLD